MGSITLSVKKIGKAYAYNDKVRQIIYSKEKEILYATEAMNVYPTYSACEEHRDIRLYHVRSESYTHHKAYIRYDRKKKLYFVSFRPVTTMI